MFTQAIPGSIEIICGSMFSGKTEELVRRLKRAQIARQKIQVFKPKIDNRYSEGDIQSHDGLGLPSEPVSNAAELLSAVEDNTRTIGIDEIQFFDPAIVDTVQKLAYRGARIIAAGLDMDFRGQPFGPIPQLLAIAERVTKLSAVCMVCGGIASRTQRLTPRIEEQVVVGAADVYEARCRFCHEPNISRLSAPAPTGLNLKPESESESEPVTAQS